MYKKFAKLLEESGLKAADVSRGTGISSTVFSEWKKGKSDPKIDKLTKIASFFSVPVSYFLDENEYQENEPIYFGDETKYIIDSLRKRPEMRILFKASENATKEDILMTAEILKKFKKGE